MSEEQLNSYRLTSMEEPTDEMLAYIMREAAEEAKKRSEAAHQRLFEGIAEMRKKYAEKQ